MSKTIREEIETLREELRRHNKLYYVDAASEITDREYDRLMKQLEKLEAEHPEYDSPDSPTHQVGGEPIDGFTTVTHRVPMLSIDNAFNTEELTAFDQRVRKLLATDDFEYTLEYKIDGVALSLIYEEGSLTQAVTRGNGVEGDDVTHNARVMRGVPLKLLGKNLPAVLEVRGEAYIRNSDFAEIRAEQEAAGEQVFANPRNATSGALKRLDPTLSAKMRLHFFAHGIGYTEGVEFETQHDFIKQVQQMGVPTTPEMVRCANIDDVQTKLEMLIDKLPLLDFEVDGIVVKVDRLDLREELGNTSKSPRWVIAYKWEKYEAVTQVREIEISVGKTGALTPLAHLEPVEIAGTTVSRSSLHNRDEIERLDIREGDWVVVEKAGKIIPHVVRVEIHRRTGDEKPYKFPIRCPACGGEVQQDEGGVYIRCINLNCPAQLRETLRFYASRSAMDIEGMGIKLVEQLIEAGLLTKLTDIYRLAEKRDELLALERMGEKSVDNLLTGIEKSKVQPLWRLLTGLNIRHIGARGSQILAEEFGTMDKIMEQSVDELAAVEEIGPVIAESVHQFFQSTVGQETVKELKAFGLNMGTPVSDRKQSSQQAGILAGKTLVVTGTLKKFTRDEIHEMIRAEGGKAASSVSSKTDFLVAGEKAGSKLDKAGKLGVAVLSEEEFLSQIGKE
ncbi:MAG: NAD-dependent DNA ligase LigA [Planctomycetaceae bacterium]|nr:NAD-dependent DNA ligase LigA [Planctomycetaceae bacterium]